MTTEIHTDSGGHSDNTAANHIVVQQDALISDALELHKSQLQLKLSVMLETAGERLIHLIQDSETGPDQAPDDEAETERDQKNDNFEKLVRTLQSERDNIENYFFRAISDNYNEGQSQTEQQSPNNKLSLIDQHEMDEMVAVTALYTNAMNQYGEEVNNLATRFDYLEMLSKRTLPKHIFDLRHICEAFQSALGQIDLSTDHKLLLYKLFDQDVSSHLGGMYKALNQLFIDAGVLPEVVYSVKNENSGRHPSEANDNGNHNSPQQAGTLADATSTESGDQESHNNTSSQDAPGSLNKIGRFITDLMGGFSVSKGKDLPQSFTTAPNAADPDACYSRDDLMGAMSKLQQHLVDTDVDNASGFDPEHVKQSIMTNMGQTNGGAITKTMHTLDQRRIDFVGMIFREIAEDDNISMVIANLLMLLQIPILKTAMLDENLFTDTNHPARITLDLITRAGKGVTEVTDRIYVELKAIVNGILQDYDIDTASFETAAYQLQELISTEEEIAAEKEKSEQSAIIKQHARNVVLGEMRLITKHKTIPENTRPLMLKLWPTLMFNCYIRHGIESSEWLSALDTFNSLMESLQPISSRKQWRKLKANHESLVETVREELHKTRQNKEEIGSQVFGLKQTFLELLDTDQFQDEENPESDISDRTSVDTAQNVEVAGEAHDVTGHDDKAARIQEQVRIAREKISRLPTSIYPGIWFEVFNGEDKPVRRLKLSVILTDVAQLVFVDRQGAKVIEKDAEDFLHELENEQSRFIADHSTFEHALGSVIHKFAA